jgi:hypothetical protein
MRYSILSLIACFLICSFAQAQSYFAKVPGQAVLTVGNELSTFNSSMLNLSCLNGTEQITLQVKLDTYQDENLVTNLSDRLNANGMTLMRLEIPAKGFRAENGSKNSSTATIVVNLLGKNQSIPGKITLVSNKQSTTVSLDVTVDLGELTLNQKYKGMKLRFLVNEHRMEAFTNTKN